MKDYLGDAVYAEWDGYQIKLYTERENGIHEIYLDASVQNALINFIKRIAD